MFNVGWTNSLQRVNATNMHVAAAQGMTSKSFTYYCSVSFCCQEYEKRSNLPPHWFQFKFLLSFFSLLVTKFRGSNSVRTFHSYSPMMFPSAHTACSHTFWWGEWRSLKNNGTASTQSERENERTYTHTHTDQLHTERMKSKQADPVDESLSKQLTGFDHCLCLRRRPWCNVGQSPGSFKLQWRTDEERETSKFIHCPIFI